MNRIFCDKCDKLLESGSINKVRIDVRGLTCGWLPWDMCDDCLRAMLGGDTMDKLLQEKADRKAALDARRTARKAAE